ncbi:uncharacterized protein LOC117115000 [Anneissia japonica]|uniref:uncharacterized protein LOC117115000 n=1 Tax=Anneissia japonica TaxID=1529436 RepID=UPI0014258E41|nr:uncharacterized protein LOC117115000 [Anneissia japonica]
MFYVGSNDTKTIGRLVRTDFSKAFDCVDHTKAISKLVSLGCRSEILPWIISFISNRTQRVKYEGVISNNINLTCGVPQGTKFGPIIFLALIDDALNVPNCSTWKYVENLSIGEVVNKLSQSRMKNHVQNLVEWSDVNKLKLNPGKCKSMNFNFQRPKVDIPPLRMLDHVLESVSETKLLGVWIQNDLK